MVEKFLIFPHFSITPSSQEEVFYRENNVDKDMNMERAADHSEEKQGIYSHMNFFFVKPT